MPENLNTASKASQFADKINNLGSLGTDVSEFSFDLTTTEAIVGQFIESIKESIQSEDMPVTGSIEDIEMSIDEATGNIKVFGRPHLLWLDKGVNGKDDKLYDTPYTYSEEGGRPPVKIFADWIKRKGINTVSNPFFYGQAAFEELTEDEQINKVAWAMSTHIWQSGYKGRNIFSKHIPSLVDGLTEHIAGFTVENIKSQILDRYGNNVFEKGKKK